MAPAPASQCSSLAASGKIGGDLITAFDTHDRVRVIVALAVSEIQERRVAPSDRDGRRAAIRRVRDRVLHGFRADDFTVTHRFGLVSAVAGIVSSAGLVRLVNDPHVVRIDIDSGGHAQLNQAVPLTKLNILQDLGFTGKDVTVAVLDSGAHTSHPDLADSVVAEHCFCEACANAQCDRLEPCCPDGTAEQDGPGSAQDDNGHGTNVTGILTSNGQVAPRGGAPGVQIVAVKVLDSTAAFATSGQVVAGLDWVLDSRPDVRIVNMSLGTSARFIGDCDVTEPKNARVMAFTEAINALYARGVIVFASSGNQQSGNSMPLPACVAKSISVGAVWDADVGFQSALGCVDASTTADQVTCFSNSNASTDLFAPGGPTTSAGLGDPTSTFRGTSQASPIAAACAALLLEAYPDLNPDEIELALETSESMVTDVTNGLSFPRVDCEAALEVLQSRPPTATRTSSPTALPSLTLTATPPSTPTPSITATSSATSTVTQTPSASVTPTYTITATPTGSSTITPTSSTTRTPSVTRTWTLTPTITATLTPTYSATPSATPRVVRLAIGEARGRPGQTVEVVVSLETAGLNVSATSNEIEFDPQPVEFADCSLESDNGRSLIVSILRPGTIRAFVQPEASVASIADGPLYSCRFAISVSALPGTIALRGLSVLAFDAVGTRLEQTTATDGAIRVSLVPLRGDANRNGRIEPTDLDAIEEAIFSPTPPTEADANVDGRVNATDLVGLLFQLTTPGEQLVRQEGARGATAVYESKQNRSEEAQPDDGSASLLP